METAFLKLLMYLQWTGRPIVALVMHYSICTFWNFEEYSAKVSISIFIRFKVGQHNWF